jgi:hypothetical protein
MGLALLFFCLATNLMHRSDVMNGMNKTAILADLRDQFGPGSVLYAPDIAKLLKKPSTGAVYELIKRKGMPMPIKMVGGRPAVTYYDAADWLAGEAEPASQEATPPSPGKPVLPAPKHKVNKDLTKALSLLRGQQNFINEVSAELERLILQDDVPDKGERADETPKKPPRTTKVRV